MTEPTQDVVVNVPRQTGKTTRAEAEPQHRAPVADPSRPYKALAAAVVAGAGAALANGQDLLPAWAVLALTVLVAGLTTFLVPNPTRPS